MSYKGLSSEKLRKHGADAEIKAMLYLMNFREDCSENNYFMVGFSNDVTGMDRKLWYVKSKASKTASAKVIYRMGVVPDTFRIDSSQNLFDATKLI